jgi:transporter family protein
MDRWVLFAVLSMIFAGLTAVVAKIGLDGVSSELGLAVRTLFVAAFTLLFAAGFVNHGEFLNLTTTNWLWLGLSALLTTLSWIFYYKALKDGDVATVSIIDKGSVVVAVLIAWLFLGDRMTWRIALGTLLIAAGLIVVARK